jgi:hypothetical protein
LGYLCAEASWSDVLGSHRRDLAPIVVSARFAQMMRPLEFATIRAFGIGGRFQRVV